MSWLGSGLSVASIAKQLACMWVFCGVLFAQKEASDLSPSRPLGNTGAGSYRIAGRVVSATDGHALAGTTVTVWTLQGQRPVGSSVTGESGAFAFEGLSAAKYRLVGERRGYRTENYDEHEQFSTAIVTGAGVETERLVMRLKPEAVLNGKVLDEAGEPVRSAQVKLYREGHGTGRRQIRQVAGAQTDDRGEFTVGSLAEGTYFVAARGTPWYAVHPPTAGADTESPVITGVDPALDVTYALTFYGDVTNPDEALPLVLKSGQTITAELHLRPVKAGRIRMHVEPVNGSFAVPTFRTRVFDGYDQSSAQMNQDATGGMEIFGLAPGQYEMEQRDPMTGAATRRSVVHVTSGTAEFEEGSGEVPSTLTVSVEEENGAKLPTQTSVILHGSQQDIVSGLLLNAQGQAVFQGLRAGDYHVAIYGSNRTWQVVRAERDGRKLPSTRWTIQAGDTATIKLVIAATASAVEGVALRDGKPAAGAMIVLVPVDAMGDAEMFRRDQSDLDGTFSLPSVAAGRYIVVAIDDGWKLEWGKAEVLATYLTRGAAVEIPANEQQPVHLPYPITVQPR